jgi:hypothetical protein
MGTVWKAHKLAKPPANALDLWKGAKVEAMTDLPGVPAGTPGRVILANGFNWLRYRVAFQNGAELADLDERHITPIGRTAKRVDKRAKRAQRT